MRRLGTSCLAACLLVSTTLVAFTAAQPPLVPPPLNDALISSTFPPFPPVAPGVDVRAEWEQLVAQAREHARAELEKEREEHGGEDKVGQRKEQAAIKVVRETFFVPLGGAEVPQSGPVAAAASEATSAARIVGSAAQVEEAPADIVKTVSKLKALNPVFTYAIHHPLRFLYRFTLLPLVHLLIFLLSTLLTLLLTAVQLLLTPLHLTFLVIASPFSTFFNLASALLPLWATLLGAILAGSGLGALAGLVAGRTTREIIDETVDTARGALAWLGVVKKKEAPASTQASSAASSPGATFERISNFGASRAKAQQDPKGKGKQRAYLSSSLSSSHSPDFPSFSSASPTLQRSRAFNPIVPSSLPRAPTAGSSRPSRFPSSSSAAGSSALPARFSKYAAKEEEAPDPPSEELDLGVRSEEKKPGGLGGKGGWRGRKVDLS